MPRYSPEWLDRMYNNRALVPEHPQHFERSLGGLKSKCNSGSLLDSR
jgi:hypothetical protein